MASVLPRPRQVTISAWMIMAGSVAVVLTVFQQIAGLHTVDTREAFARVLGEPPFDSMGISVDELLTVVRVLSMIAAACATATAILGWQVLQRSRSARVALSILAGPLFLTGIGTGGILSTVVAVAIVLLWVQPARDWFDGRWQPEPDPQRSPMDRRASRGPVAPDGEHGADGHQPPATQEPWPAAGQQPAPQAPPPYSGWPPASWPPPGTQAAPHPAPQLFFQPAPSVRRPAAVVAAAVMTWVCSLLLGGLFVVVAAWLVASPDTLMDEMAKQNPELVRDGTLTVGVLRALLVAMAGAVGLWSIAASVVAFFVLRGAAWARVLLLVSSAAAGLGLLLGTLANPALAVPLAGAVAVFALLLRRDVVAWFSARAAQRRAG